MQAIKQNANRSRHLGFAHFDLPEKRALRHGDGLGRRALTLGRRDNLNIDHITETYVNAGLGLTISNKWFVRRKFK